MDSPFHSSWAAARDAINSYDYAPGFVGVGSAHVMGGCAMGSDSRCVVDSDGQHKHVENLYVFDGSVFPTSLGVNPQLTIYGMTARNAGKLAEKLTAEKQAAVS
jgi:choline dehydrogenase-like flavoprotein